MLYYPHENVYKNTLFTFVELIISISILILISVIAITAMGTNSQKANNTKIESDTITIKNALLNYNIENKALPNPSGNVNYFKNDSSYGHSGDTNNFGVYGSITEKTLPKKYLDNIPLDPVTNQYYSYGKTLDNKYFEIASILRNSETVQTKLDGTYPGEFGPISLIRAYNSSFFISNQSQTHLPYNPDEHTLIVTDNNKKVYRVGETITTASETKTLYFSDGSISELKPNSSLTISELDFKSPQNNLLTTVKLFLSSGQIFTKATALNPEGSDFQIYTSDTTAAVRGTIFSVSYNAGTTQVSVLQGQVDITQDQQTRPAPQAQGTLAQELQDFASISLKENKPVKVDTSSVVPVVGVAVIPECEGLELSDGTCLELYKNKQIDKEIRSPDFLKYTVDLGDDDFAMEMRVKVSSSSSTSKYLFHSGDFKVYFKDGKLEFKKGDNTNINPNSLTIGQFNTISVKRENKRIFTKVGAGSWEDTGIDFNDRINDLIVGAAPLGSVYINQINDIIDYLKIYK